MNTVLVLTHNCLKLTQKCVASLLDQDVPTKICLIDNGSDDETPEWYANHFDSDPERFDGVLLSENRGVSWSWNYGLAKIFSEGARQVTVVNNDTIFPRWFVSTLLSYDLPFITGVSVDNMDAIREKPERSVPSSHPDFSAYSISAEGFKSIGPFDERMVHYASDCDYHIRAHRKGIRLLATNLPFYHERSSTIRLNAPDERRRIEMQADRDRAAFREKYGCIPGEPAYEAMFAPEMFGIEAVR